MANSLTLKTYLAPEMPFWTFYHRMRNLRLEGFVELVRGSAIFKSSLWHLNKKGFLTIADDLGELSEDRFLPHSVPHDGWVLAAQLGEYIHGIPEGVALFTEQQFRTTHQSLIPEWLPRDKTHLPDGFTYVGSGNGKTLFCHEVELHLKPIERYDAISTYYDRQKVIDQVLWFVRSKDMIAKILARFKLTETVRISNHNFVLLEDFNQHGWNSRILCGDLKAKSINELMFANNQKIPRKLPENHQQPKIHEIFLNSSKSPKFHTKLRTTAS